MWQGKLDDWNCFVRTWTNLSGLIKCPDSFWHVDLTFKAIITSMHHDSMFYTWNKKNIHKKNWKLCLQIKNTEFNIVLRWHDLVKSWTVSNSQMLLYSTWDIELWLYLRLLTSSCSSTLMALYFFLFFLSTTAT